MRRQPKSQKHSVDGEVPNVNLIQLRHQKLPRPRRSMGLGPSVNGEVPNVNLIQVKTGHGLNPRFREGEGNNNAAMSETLVS